MQNFNYHDMFPNHVFVSILFKQVFYQFVWSMRFKLETGFYEEIQCCFNGFRNALSCTMKHESQITGRA